jgi:tRNA nucleotidyltransferase (CCA-adding enzyme)
VNMDSMPPTVDGLTVITSHVNADFDAMASMLAAQKLYPGALVVYPGSQEKTLRNFFVSTMVYLFNMVDLRDLNFAAVKRLVLVDTRQAGRIGKLAALLDKPDLEVHVYDHHPSRPDDIVSHAGEHRLVGATVTLLTDILRRRHIPITADEATVMCLGIYEDTGAFTFTSTTEEDFHAAAYLLSRGANLNTVAQLIAREISPEQVGLLNDMIQSLQRTRINGIEVALTVITSDRYIADLALLVHKLVRMENLDALFTVAQMENKVYVIGRSRVPEVDVDTVLDELGGGGHPSAASATVRGLTLAQVEQRLRQRLASAIRSNRLARDLMSSPPILVAADATCAEAQTLLRRYNVNALAVTENGAADTSLVGYITRQVVEKALYHGLEKVPVREYMGRDVASVGPMADMREIQEKIIGHKQRILPVCDARQVLGVITRTDLLNLLVHAPRAESAENGDALEGTFGARTRNIAKLMQERLPARLIDILQTVGTVADEIGCNACVVGGFVRDLFLHRPNEDVDIVIEGDGIGFARRLAQGMGGRLHSHEKFGTAVVILPDGFKIDVASARMEYYQFPAALPTVEMSSIKMDLFRRDFTINTLAIQLNVTRFGTLVDFFSALKDIKEKTIRVLHNLSFVEDPTRVFRAIRFEQRFGFTIGRLTAGLIENAARMDFVKRLDGRRVFTELRLLLDEENPLALIRRLNDFDLLKVIYPKLALTAELESAFENVNQVETWHGLLFLDESYMKWAVYFMALVRPFDHETTDTICRRFDLPPRLRRLFGPDRLTAERLLHRFERRLPETPAALCRALEGLGTEQILLMMALTERTEVKRAISLYVTKLRFVRPAIGGADLKRMGIAPGPVYGRILDAVRDAKRNEQLASREEELALAAKLGCVADSGASKAEPTEPAGATSAYRPKETKPTP